MKAVAFFEHGSTDVLQYNEAFPDPVAGKSEVVIDIEYCGLNHLDIWTRQGTTPDKKIRLPHICGCDIVGTTTNGQRVMIYPGISCGKCQVPVEKEEEEQTGRGRISAVDLRSLEA